MDTQTPFDRRAVRAHRDRAAGGNGDADFLVTATAEALADRLDDIAREFPKALNLGYGGGAAARALEGHGGIQSWVHTDLSPAMVAKAKGRNLVAADEEALPFAAEAFDVVVSALDLHWINDLPGTLVQARRCLKPDGLFLVALLGGDTVFELRQALLEAEQEIEGGFSPRTSPFLDVRDAGNLLARAGFHMAVADSDTTVVSYPDPLSLMADLRAMGETNAVSARRKHFTQRATLMRAAELYSEAHGDDQGRVPATFQVITMTGWAPLNKDAATS
jgi:NADH dehydrogenase [ubiquinone] 1 alpha subcomplex assembly factor 5